MPPKKNRRSPTLDIPAIAPGLIDVERIKDLMVEPDAYRTAGELAILGDAFSVLGEHLTDAAKTLAGQQIAGGVGASSMMEDAGVHFRWVAPSKPIVSLKTSLIKELYPRKDNPDLYEEKPGRASYISVTT